MEDVKIEQIETMIENKISVNVKEIKQDLRPYGTFFRSLKTTNT